MSARAQKNPRDPTTVLFGDYHRRLLGLLLMRPDKAFHLREIERETGVPSGPAHRELKRMEVAGLVTADRVGNQVRYQADRVCPIYPELQGIVRKTFGLADILRDALSPLLDQIDAAFVFGSVARGEEGPSSDVDLMVIGNVSFEEVVGVIYPCQAKLARQINPILMRAEDFATRSREPGFVARVLSGPRIMLAGALDDA